MACGGRVQDNLDPAIRLRVLAVALAVFLPLLIKGCSLLGWDERGGEGPDVSSRLKFSHAKHAIHINDCMACHAGSETRRVGTAGHAACVNCHVEADENWQPRQDCLMCHADTAPRHAGRSPRPNYARAIFDHENHMQVGCSTCHGDVNQARRFRHVNYPRMEDCLECHHPGLTKTYDADCRLCHSELTSRVRPDNHHQPNWEFVHGGMSRSDPQLCARCHDQANDCEECHSRKRPRSHTAAFRFKTHGFHAMSNPVSCEACHHREQNFCSECHSRTEPLSHTAAFKGRPWLHCAGCHLPLDDGNRCAVCHKGDPHRNVIASPPPPHLVASGRIDPAGACLPCHPVGRVPITHPYNTVTPFQCVHCHIPQ